MTLPQGIFKRRPKCAQIFTTLFSLSSGFACSEREREKEERTLPVGNLLINYLHICHKTNCFEIAIFDCAKKMNCIWNIEWIFPETLHRVYISIPEILLFIGVLTPTFGELWRTCLQFKLKLTKRQSMLFKFTESQKFSYNYLHFSESLTKTLNTFLQSI